MKTKNKNSITSTIRLLYLRACISPQPKTGDRYWIGSTGLQCAIFPFSVYVKILPTFQYVHTLTGCNSGVRFTPSSVSPLMLVPSFYSLSRRRGRNEASAHSFFFTTGSQAHMRQCPPHFDAAPFTPVVLGLFSSSCSDQQSVLLWYMYLGRSLGIRPSLYPAEPHGTGNAPLQQIRNNNIDASKMGRGPTKPATCLIYGDR